MELIQNPIGQHWMTGADHTAVSFVSRRTNELIVSVPNDRNKPDLFNAGRAAAEHLQGPNVLTDLGIVHKGELRTMLKTRKVDGAELVDRLPIQYHLVEVPGDDIATATARILRWHNDPSGSIPGRGYVDHVEQNRWMSPAQPKVDLGANFTFTAKHDDYMKMLGLDPRPSSRDGKGVRVAIVDSGLDPGAVIAATTYNDVIGGGTGQRDQSGHGTAMAKIINAVAPQAEIHIVRAFDSGAALLLDVIAGITTAYFGAQAQVINCSLGFNNLAPRCAFCGGSGGGRSKTLEDLIKLISTSTSLLTPPPPTPIIVASVGNDYTTASPASFRSPADDDWTLAVGAITSQYDLSPFSNRGTTKDRYFVLPGGDDTPDASGAAAEAIGTAVDAAGATTYCCGTSPAAAYASGLLALYWAEPAYAGKTAANFIDAMVLKCDTNVFVPYSALDHGKGFFRYL